MNESFLLYSGASTDGATHLDLIIAVYDGLAQDLNRVADAVAVSDIEKRCKWSRHALLLIGYLQTWVELLQEPELERGLNVFYAFLRAELMRIQTSQDKSLARELAMVVGEARSAWQQKLRQITASPSNHKESHAATLSKDQPRFAWSA